MTFIFTPWLRAFSNGMLGAYATSTCPLCAAARPAGGFATMDVSIFSPSSAKKPFAIPVSRLPSEVSPMVATLTVVSEPLLPGSELLEEEEQPARATAAPRATTAATARSERVISMCASCQGWDGGISGRTRRFGCDDIVFNHHLVTQISRNGLLLSRVFRIYVSGWPLKMRSLAVPAHLGSSASEED